MDVVHLNQKQLATRWCISEATLERWRSVSMAPTFHVASASAPISCMRCAPRSFSNSSAAACRRWVTTSRTADLYPTGAGQGPPVAGHDPAHQ